MYYRLYVATQAMTPPEYGLDEFVVGVEALDMPDMYDRGADLKVGCYFFPR